jgi:hypothetical protein
MEKIIRRVPFASPSTLLLNLPLKSFGLDERECTPDAAIRQVAQRLDECKQEL